MAMPARKQQTIMRGMTLACVFSILCFCAEGGTSGAENAYDELRGAFKNPKEESGVSCWWWWLNGNVDKAAITKDLEAMRARHFQGALVFDAGGYGQGGHGDVPAGPLFGSKEWIDLFVFALDEAKRLGLTVGFNIQSGWNLGGPTVPSEHAAKETTFSQVVVDGGRTVKTKLAVPKSLDGYYRDIAALAFPLKQECKTDQAIDNLDLKLAKGEVGSSAPDCRFLLDNAGGAAKKTKKANAKSAKDPTFVVAGESVVDVSKYMDADGNLEWAVPQGTWAVLRVGYTCTKAKVSTSSGKWQGKVVDYLSRDAFDFYFGSVVEPILKAAGTHVGNTLKTMSTDSWECGGMNWTDDFPAQFRKYRGYDLLQYLPVVAGYVVDDIETSNAFLADFRKTIGDLIANNHYARFQECAHKYNMGIQPESAGPHAGPFDGIKDYGYSDIAMSEFWAKSEHRGTPASRFFVKQASSAAHIYGKKIVGAESFTTIGPQWNDELWQSQKPAFDHEICAGLNRVHFHTFTCSPPKMGFPGQEYFAGTHMNPQVTWWPQSGAYIDYLHRVQSVVQEGAFVADALYYYGDQVPNIFPFKYADPGGVMPGFDYDVTDETILLRLKVENGKVMVPGGIAYRILILPDHKVLSLAALQKVESLLRQGATVLGPKPERLVSLVGGKEAQAEFHGLADRIWDSASAAKGEKPYGKGVVAWGMTGRDFLLSKGIPEDFSLDGEGLAFNGKHDEINFDYIHYALAGADVYFVSNQTGERQRIVARFRVSGKQPELWDALTGEIRNAAAFAQKNGETTVPLVLEPYGSIMIAFKEPTPSDRQGEATRNYPDYEPIKNIDGKWNVAFDPAWGAPARVVFDKLVDWTQHPDDGIKYYSGPAVYVTDFSLDGFDPKRGEKYYLSLGSVKDVGIAEVTVNGIDKGVLWTAPFRVEIGDALRQGKNELTVKVVNSWYNRVVGDQLSPDTKPFTKTNIRLGRNKKGKKLGSIALSSSGLLGPVVIEKAK